MGVAPEMPADDPGGTFVQRVAERHGLDLDVSTFEPGTTATVETAAAQLDCDPSRIVASIVCTVDDAVVVALVSGDRQVDMDRLAAVHGGKSASLAPPDLVASRTGYPVGGVPPFGHDEQLPTYLDERTLDHVTVFPAAGTAERLFEIDPERLLSLSDATVADVTTD
jgi:Cys-tRNA(Pro) deacylase